MIPLRITSLFGFLALCAAATAQTPGFWLMGTAPGTMRSKTYALSQDGSIAAGQNIMTSPPFGVPGFTWTQSGGRSDFGLEPGMPLVTAATGLNSSGNTIVGYMADTTTTRAFRRVGSGPLQDLGSGGYQRSYAWATNGDGSTVAGGSESGSGGGLQGQALRWTESGGLQFLGWLRPGSRTSRALGISRDGSTIVGYSDAGADEAFVWRQSTGIQPLPPLPGANTLFSYARGVNADGSIIVGQADNAAGFPRAVRWLPSGPQDLGVGGATAVSDDGSVVVGLDNFLWTPSTGRTTLTAYLGQFGVSVSAGWTVRTIYAISGDGRTFAGEAVNGSQIQGFVASIPAPAGAGLLMFWALVHPRRRSPRTQRLLPFEHPDTCLKHPVSRDPTWS